MNLMFKDMFLKSVDNIIYIIVIFVYTSSPKKGLNEMQLCGMIH